MDQREWDADARLPRDRQEAWSSQSGPERPEKPPSDAIADTGSLQPIPDALAWAQRAEAWAEPPDGETRAGLPTHSADDLTRRTETVEWPGRHQFDSARPWQSAPDTPSAWQQFGAPPQPEAQTSRAVGDGSAATAASVDNADTVSRPAWQQPPASAPTAAQSVDTANTLSPPPWQQSVATPAQRSGEESSWQRLSEPGTYASSGSAGFENNGHPVPGEETWRIGGVGNSLVVGRRRAPEDSGSPQIWEPGEDRAGAPTWRDRSGAPGAHHAERVGRHGEAGSRNRHRSEFTRWDDPDDGDRWESVPPAARRYDDPDPAGPPPWGQDESDPGWPDRSDGWRSEPDSGSWSHGDEARTVNRRRADSVDDDTDLPGWRDAGPHTDGWRGDVRPAADPWAQHAADTGFVPMSWDQPGAHAGSWRSDPDDQDERDYRGHRRLDQPPLDPQVWQRGPGRPADEPQHGDHRERPVVGEAATEVLRRTDPERPQPDRRDAGTGQGPAAGAGTTYRSGDPGNWRRELSEESDLAEGEARRFGTEDFVPFRPAGTAPPPGYGSPAQRGPVGRSNDARWHERPDSRRASRGAVTGPDERRAADSVSAAPGRSNLLEPEDETEQNNGGPLAAVGYTVIWYGVPVVLFVLYMLLVTGDEKARALSTLAKAAPQFGLSLAVSMLVAVILRWISGAWKAVSVGLAAAVLGGGLATVLASAISGNPLS